MPTENTTVPAQRPLADTAPALRTVTVAGAQIDLVALRDSLTPAQRMGRACVQCGRNDERLESAGTLLDVQVVECFTHRYSRHNAASPADWLSISACPSWCNSGHRGSDHPDDRQHGSLYLETVLQTMRYDDYGLPGKPEYKPVIAGVNLIQHYRETEPRICVSDTGEHGEYYLTLDEAQKIALDLLTLVLAGRDRAEITEMEDSVNETPGCRSWCTRHGSDDTCDSGVREGAWLTQDREDGALIWYDGYGDDGMDVQHAERLVHSILNLAVLARHSRSVA
ncbi:hypothetical protein [Planomonospora algeriensis]